MVTRTRKTKLLLYTKGTTTIYICWCEINSRSRKLFGRPESITLMILMISPITIFTKLRAGVEIGMG